MKRIILTVIIIAVNFIGNIINAQSKGIETTKNQWSDSLPFIGERGFETRYGVSGSGTPSWYIEIQKNGDVYFSFEQRNSATSEITKGRYYCGKFKTYMKCAYKDWGNEVRYYKITKNKIYEVDKNNNLLISDECCADGIGKCPCEGNLWTDF